MSLFHQNHFSRFRERRPLAIRGSDLETIVVHTAGKCRSIPVHHMIPRLKFSIHNGADASTENVENLQLHEAVSYELIANRCSWVERIWIILAEFYLRRNDLRCPPEDEIPSPYDDRQFGTISYCSAHIDRVPTEINRLLTLSVDQDNIIKEWDAPDSAEGEYCARFPFCLDDKIPLLEVGSRGSDVRRKRRELRIPLRPLK